jgi:hypothetical protein
MLRNDADRQEIATNLNSDGKQIADQESIARELSQMSTPTGDLLTRGTA